MLLQKVEIHWNFISRPSVYIFSLFLITDMSGQGEAMHTSLGMFIILLNIWVFRTIFFIIDKNTHKKVPVKSQKKIQLI